MKLYATVTSERASKGQGGNDFIRIELKGEGEQVLYWIDYTEAGIRLSAKTDTGGVVLYEARAETKGKKQKGDIDIAFSRLNADER